MGVLDEAIREHLELKRRRGADPGAVARQENDALGATRAEGSPAADRHDGAPRDEAQPDDWGVPDAAYQSDSYRPTDFSDDLHRPTDLSDPAQETAELDMRTVFDDDEPAHGPARNPVEPGDLVEPDRLWLEPDSQRSGLLA